MLNERARSFLRPEPNLRELVAFDPWASELLWEAIVEPRAVAGPERRLVQKQLLPTDTVVYWGIYCSAWTNYVRSAQRNLRIFETEGHTPLADTLGRRNIRHVRLLVLEDMNILNKFFEEASNTLIQAQVDMILFRLDTDRAINAVSRELSAIGYRIVRLSKNPLTRVKPYSSRGESYLATRKGLATPSRPLLLPFYLNTRKLLRRFAGG
jgi:hypothetical protein